MAVRIFLILLSLAVECSAQFDPLSPFNPPNAHGFVPTVFTWTFPNLIAGKFTIDPTNGLLLDPGGTTAAWAAIGTNVNYATIDTTFVLNKAYGVADPQDHCGVAFASSDASGTSFSAGFFCNLGNGKLDSIDRTNGTEVYDSTFTTVYGFTTNMQIRMLARLTNTLATCSVWTNGVLAVNNATHNLMPGAVTNGWLMAHCYGATASYRGITNTGPSGSIISAPPLYANESATLGLDGDMVASGGGSLTIHCDGSDNSANDYKLLMSQFAMTNGTINFTMQRVSGRGMGILFAGTNSGRCYVIWYDNNNTQFRLFHYVNGGPTVLSASSSVTMNTGVDYPCSLTISGTNFTFVGNGVTFNAHDNASVSSGYVGMMGFQSVVKFQNWTNSPGP